MHTEKIIDSAWQTEKILDNCETNQIIINVNSVSVIVIVKTMSHVDDFELC